MTELMHPYDGALIVSRFPLLQFHRSPIDRDILMGFAIGWNVELTLIQVMDGVHFRLNGYAIFRNSDVKRWRPLEPDTFVGRAAKLNKLRPSRPASVSFASMKEAVSTVGAAFPPIAIHRERLHRGVCYVGRLQKTNQRAATILPISPQAEWEAAEECYQLKDITLLEFDGTYENLLARMARPIG
jgi:hypothetical protein